MKIWKICWIDKSSEMQIRYRNSKHAAIARKSRVRKQGCVATIEHIKVPACQFGFVDWINSEMTSLQKEEVK